MTKGVEELFELTAQQRGVYIGELRRQARNVEVARDDLNQALQAKDLERIEVAVTAIITAAAKVARILFPSDLPKDRDPQPIDVFRVSRGKYLRTLLSITRSGSPLAARSLRNHLEHFDERVDNWALDTKPRSFVGWAFGSLKPIQGLDPKDIMRHLDAERGMFNFQGEAFDLNKLLGAIDELSKKAAEVG